MIADTDVLIDFLRGYPRAKRKLEKVGPRRISIISLYELLQGARDKRELREIRAFIREWEFNVIPLDHEVSFHALFLLENYTLSHGLRMADALIGACALSLQEPLLTGNVSDYTFMDGLVLERYKR